MQSVTVRSDMSQHEYKYFINVKFLINLLVYISAKHIHAVYDSIKLSNIEIASGH